MTSPRSGAEMDSIPRDFRLPTDRHNSQAAKTLLWAARMYIGIELLFNFGQVVISNLHNAFVGEAQSAAVPQPVPWDFTLGIEATDATSIVVALAALVITINVAVLPARLTATQEVSVEVDLSRWQKNMEMLAVVAASVALVVTATQFSERQLGKFITLALVSSVALAASDVRIGARLSTLRIAKKVAEIRLSRARQRLQALEAALPQGVRKGMRNQQQGKAAYWWRIALTIGAITAFETLALTLIWGPDAYSSGDKTSPGDTSTGEFALGVSLVLCFLILTFGPVHAAISYVGSLLVTMRAESPLAEPGVLKSDGTWTYWLAGAAAVAYTWYVLVMSVSLFADQLLLVVAIGAAGCAIHYFLIQIALWTGRGPGVTAVWLALGTRKGEVEIALKELEAARAALKSETELQSLFSSISETKRQSSTLARRIIARIKGTSKPL